MVFFRQYNRIDISEEIDVNKTNKSKEYGICHYWYVLDKSFKYEPYLCNGCHDSIISVKGSDFRIHFSYLSKGDAINIMKNANLKSSGLL